jgi:hypothetical protein
MPFPTSQNEELAPFLKRDLQFSMKIKEDTLDVTLKKEKIDGTLDETTQDIRPKVRRTNQGG